MHNLLISSDSLISNLSSQWPTPSVELEGANFVLSNYEEDAEDVEYMEEGQCFLV